MIDSHPDSCSVLFGTVRRATTRRFPYSIIYTEHGDTIVVLACFHGKRDPKRWQDRVNR